MFKRHKVTIIKELDTSTTPNTSRALLVHVNGKSSLKTTYYNDPEDEYGIASNVTIYLNDVPLIYSKRSACPTCASIITTGHGLEEKEVISNISDLINKDFVSLEKSIQDMGPLLMLLEPGLYVIGDIKHYPTDGMNQFFWNTNNKFEVNHASSPAHLPHFELDHFYFDGTPSYLYPTQHSKFYNSDRVEYYKNRLKNTNNKPRAIVYNFEEYLSFIIDGHHKACAATLLNESVDTITIIPSTGRSTQYPNTSKQLHYYTFGSFKILEKEIPRRYREDFIFPKKKNNQVLKSHQLNERIWEDDYLTGASKYPSLEVLALSQGYDFDDLSDSFIYSLFNGSTHEPDLKIDVILARMIVTRDSRLKEYASYCLLNAPNTSAKELAIKCLLTFDKDEEVEQSLIEYLIIDQDYHSTLKPLIISYWE